MNAPPRNAIKAGSSGNPGRTNPFCVVSAFNLPLKAETCQQMHAGALRGAARNTQAYAAPLSIAVDRLRAHARRYGPQVYLAHPAEIERLFRGVTLSVYQEIESLYCSRLGRNYATVYRILQAMALEAGIAPVEEEAIWAICMHLEPWSLMPTLPRPSPFAQMSAQQRLSYARLPCTTPSHWSDAPIQEEQAGLPGGCRLLS